MNGFVVLPPDRMVTWVARCDLRVSDAAWPYAQSRAAEIEVAWQARIARAPDFFNGVVHALRPDLCAMEETGPGARFVGQMWRTDFKSFVHWRNGGSPRDASAIDCFGSAVVRSREGYLLLGRQRQGLNAGLTYFPGGFIDETDVDASGNIKLDGSIARELGEETGLDAATLERIPGYLLTRSGSLLSIGVVYQSRENAADLRKRILASIAADPAPELADVTIVRTPADLAAHRVPHYSQLIVTHLLDNA